MPVGRLPPGLLRVRTLAAVVGILVVLAVGSQLVAAYRAPAATPSPPPVEPLQPTVGDLDLGTGPSVGRSQDLIRINADIAFWSARVTKNPLDFVSATQWGINETTHARVTGDVTDYLRAQAAFQAALKTFPEWAPAQDYAGAVMVALHRFPQAIDAARAALAQRPTDAAAMATLGDASLELGDMATARSSYLQVATLAPSAASLVRLGHLAFIEGDIPTALADSRQAVTVADTEGAEGERAAWYRYQLGEVLISTGNQAGALAAYQAALSVDPTSYLARWGLAHVDAAQGNLDAAISELDQAIAIIPLPDYVARRADLYTLRGGPGDATRAAQDLSTVEAIAKLAGEAASVYDRTLSLYLANHGLEPTRALSLAQDELQVRKDVYGYDAYGWALQANGRYADADAAMKTALAFGTQDPKILYHAGVIASDVGDHARAKQELTQALALDPGFDPLQAKRARELLATL